MDAFLADAADAGVDGLIVVDVPPEADDELCLPALQPGSTSSGSAPTTTDDRLETVLANTQRLRLLCLDCRDYRDARADTAAVERSVARIKARTPLPVVTWLRRSHAGAGRRDCGRFGWRGGGVRACGAIAQSLDDAQRATSLTKSAVLDLVGSFLPV